MAKGRSQFVGLAGQYYAAYCLAVRDYHVAITGGNVPDVDILVSLADGSRLLSLQVKTQTNALRRRRFESDFREWFVGTSAVGRSNDNLWYVFIDLQESENDEGLTTWQPKAFLVPSTWVAAMVQEHWSMKNYFLHCELWSECEERWDRIKNYFEK